MIHAVVQVLAQSSGVAGWDSSPLFAVLLVLLGFAFVVAEIFTVTFGLFTLCALTCLIGGVVVGFRAGPGWGITLAISIVVLLPVLIVTLLKAMPNTRWGKRLIPESPKLEDVSGTGAEQNLSGLVGKRGRTLSMCRPAGTAEFDGNRFAVVSEDIVIAADRPVEVMGVEGNRIVVREVT
jgi:membrane-bound serine protease (ClpP class)